MWKEELFERLHIFFQCLQLNTIEKRPKDVIEKERKEAKEKLKNKEKNGKEKAGAEKKPPPPAPAPALPHSAAGESKELKGKS